MPNYDDDATECGWVKSGQKWTHPGFPGEVYRSAVDIYKHPSLDKVRRPTSATPRDEPKPAPEPVKPPEPVMRDFDLPRRGRPKKTND